MTKDNPIFVPFWNNSTLNICEHALLHKVLEAHRLSAMRDNVSTHVLANVAVGSGDYCNAVASAILSIGKKHAPLAETMAFLSNSQRMPVSDEIVPGWGNSFVKGKPDELWFPVDECLLLYWPDMHARIRSITDCLSTKNLHPNPSAYTAAAAIILNIPPSVTPWLFICGRLEQWSKTFLCHA